MGIKVTKEQGVMVSLSTILTVVVSVATSYPTAKAVLAQEIKEQIQTEIRPLTDAFTITLQQNVRSLRNSIAAMEFKKDMCGSATDCWTVRDAQDLANAREDLRAAEIALAGIRGEA